MSSASLCLRGFAWEADRWQEGDSPFGLAKVRVRQLVMKKKKKKAKAEDEAEGEVEATTET